MKENRLLTMVFASTLLALSCAVGQAQNSETDAPQGPAATSGYHVTPDAPAASQAAAPEAPPTNATTANSGPVRLARFSDVEGDVSWRPTTTDEWSTAGVNIPLREGAQVWVTNGGRAEIQFDDGSYIRLGDGGILTLQSLYSDDKGEFTELRLNQGLATLDLKNQSSIYQLDTPLTAVKATGGSNVRVGVNGGVEVAVHSGKAVLTGSGGSTNLITGNYTYVADASAPYTVEPIPTEDSWDRWNDAREGDLADAATDEHCPRDISTCAGNLDAYGVWREDPDYGWVWCPHEPSPYWRPYEYGSWVYCAPFGWTWCSTEPWGWAPYHYGTWFHARYGWAWAPGPARQYWCPAVVSFTDYNGEVGWCPLAPHDVNYASISFGFGRGGSFFGFSIGEAGCYYPGADGLFIGLAFSTYDVNYYGRPGYIPQHPGFFNGPRFGGGHVVPRNARFGGLMTASAASFGGAHDYHPGPANGAAYFAHGDVASAPKAGGPATFGPANVKATATSWTPTRTVESGSRFAGAAASATDRADLARQNVGLNSVRDEQRADSAGGHSGSTFRGSGSLGGGGSSRRSGGSLFSRIFGGGGSESGHGGGGGGFQRHR